MPNIKHCDTCGKSFDAVDHRARFCSNECVIEWRTGDTSPVWKGGNAAHRIRSQFKGDIAVWRKSVYARDNYTCQKCGNRENIQAHHIKSISEYPEHALELDNGITLCIACHGKAHGRKLSLHSKYPKRCNGCGIDTSGRNKYCRSCSIKLSWSEGRHARPKRTG